MILNEEGSITCQLGSLKPSQYLLENHETHVEMLGSKAFRFIPTSSLQSGKPKVSEVAYAMFSSVLFLTLIPNTSLNTLFSSNSTDDVPSL